MSVILLKKLRCAFSLSYNENLRVDMLNFQIHKIVTKTLDLIVLIIKEIPNLPNNLSLCKPLIFKGSINLF